MKILALDLGDVWTGSAISDASELIATPYQTIETNKLEEFLTRVIGNESISTIVVGYPQTLSGRKSQQTEKVIAHKMALEKKFPQIRWEFWDERLTSKQAEQLKKNRSKEQKQKIHSVAAAFILSGYLEFERFGK